jgi:fumarate reductase subunit C
MAENVARHPTAPRTRPAVRPGEYRRPWPADWWLRRPSYFLFMLREFTALFVGAYALFLLILAALGRDAFAAVVQSPLNGPALDRPADGALPHRHLAEPDTEGDRAVAGGGTREPKLIAAAHYAAWLVLSAVIVGLALWIA